MSVFQDLECQRMNVGELIDMYLNHAAKRLRTNTMISYVSASKHIKQAFEHVDIADLQYKNLSRWHVTFSISKPKMADICLSLIDGTFKFAASIGVVEPQKNPCPHIQRSPPNKRTRYLSDREVKRFIKSTYEVEEERVESANFLCKNKDYGIRAKRVLARSATVAIRMILYTGCRKREITNAKVSQLKPFSGGTGLHLPSTKTRPRIVALPTLALKELKDFRKRVEACSEIRDSEFLFPSSKDHRKSLYKLEHVWTKILETSGLDDVCIRDLRRTYASHAILAGCHFSDVAVQLGHESDQTTRQIYANLVVSPSAKFVAQKVGARMKRIFEKR